jgi:hypothetical protein
MKTALRLMVVVFMAAATRGVAQVPYTDGDMNVPSGCAQAEPQEKATCAEEDLGGGSGEPGRAEGRVHEEMRPRDEVLPRALEEQELFTDRG